MLALCRLIPPLTLTSVTESKIFAPSHLHLLLQKPLCHRTDWCSRQRKFFDPSKQIELSFTQKCFSSVEKESREIDPHSKWRHLLLVKIEFIGNYFPSCYFLRNSCVREVFEGNKLRSLYPSTCFSGRHFAFRVATVLFLSLFWLCFHDLEVEETSEQNGKPAAPVKGVILGRLLEL